MENILIERLLTEGKGWRWEPGYFTTMRYFYEAQPGEHKREFIAAAKEMDNAVFERTNYWNIISSYLINSIARCHRCATGYRLIVHHLNYRNRGQEHLNLQDLQVLCRDCHDSEHALAAAKRQAFSGSEKSLKEIQEDIQGKAYKKRLNAKENARFAPESRRTSDMLSITDLLQTMTGKKVQQ